MSSTISTDKFVIEGLAGAKKLSGRVKVQGAKNAALKLFAASILFKDEINLSNVPDIEDIHRVSELLEDFGVKISNKKDIFNLNTKGVKSKPFNVETAKRMRSSIVLTGPMLSRFGQVVFPFPGGCVIGKRPIDLFIDGYKKMGASVKEENNIFTINVNNKKLRGAEIFFKIQSVTATETFMIAAVLAKGRTVLKNCALEPEIVDLGEFLIAGGAKISGLGTPTIIIEGGELLSGADFTHHIIPDRIDAGSFIILGALAAKELVVEDIRPDHLDAPLNILRAMGVKMEIGDNYVKVKGNENVKYRAIDIKTHEYPGFITDLQAPMAVLLTQAYGQSFIFETIYENRLSYLEEINRMGAKTKLLDAHRAIIDGPTPLTGKNLESPDLRAGLAYVLAAIVAKGKSVIHNVYNIDRGYAEIDKRLRNLGVKITRIK
jgi:UDP-N-acetylglucosamine 1-carboxyvinyltransferase